MAPSLKLKSEQRSILKLRRWHGDKAWAACFADSEVQAEKKIVCSDLFAAMVLSDHQIYIHLDKLVVHRGCRRGVVLSLMGSA